MSDDMRFNTLEQIQKLWAGLDRDGREAHLDWTKRQCATCWTRGQVGGRQGQWNLVRRLL